MKHFKHFNNFLFESFLNEASDEEIYDAIKKMDLEIEDAGGEGGDRTNAGSKVKKIADGDKDAIKKVKEAIQRFTEAIKDETEEARQAERQAQLTKLNLANSEVALELNKAISTGDPKAVLTAMKSYLAVVKKTAPVYAKLGEE